MTIESLAETLIHAGRFEACRLEINQEWVQLNTYSTSSAGQTNGKRLLSGMQHTGNRWLTEDTTRLRRGVPAQLMNDKLRPDEVAMYRRRHPLFVAIALSTLGVIALTVRE